MKKISLILLLAFAALFVVSCDKVDEPLQPIDPVYPDDPDDPTGVKTVLIKDFTGVRCVNCPGAAETVHQLQHLYGEDKVFIMSVHAGYLAQPAPTFPDFTTEEGTAWYGNSGSNPLFNVDYVDLASQSLSVNEIDIPLDDALNEKQIFDIEIVNNYDEATRKLTTKTNIVSVAEAEGNFYMTSCLVEDSIVGKQITPAGPDESYVHRNVFRKTLNGAYGVMVQEGYVYADDPYDFQYEISLDSEYNADHCYILSYVYDNNTKKIYQTAMSKVK